ncbi:hypothetical protein [Aquibacillus rhizosphaerae]|uniref:DNA alkylation repair protein n=1 Tax=Aquibacillus rhizosphaerae TaxID=3051431 RepID=A0ABT7L8W7_9BACI|nr:hypothetical protein [Aquibacillus sp. LR5S19]MDL4842312.1 hypothetical protein [Aquibacillus sp. LR5S19]
MGEPLKDIYHEQFFKTFAQKVHQVYPAFSTNSFVEDIMNEDWEKLELKKRIRHISITLGKHLPANFEEAIAVLYQIDETCVGFPYLFFPDFIEVYGQKEEHWELSMAALQRFTSKSSSEFAIRPFILLDPERAMNQMKSWATHSNEHVRRLASEGCRPSLPWGQALPIFKKDPTPPLSILEILKNDPSLYVRKSVANNLNDIAKDNPSVVLETARRWKGVTPGTDWIIRHGCRTLIRQANPEVLTLFGYTKINNPEDLFSVTSLSLSPSHVTIGEANELEYELHIREGAHVHIRIEYGIDFIKSRGTTSRKLFLLSDREVPGGSTIKKQRKLNWNDLSTRKHYPGEHKIVLLVNGVEVAEDIVELKAKDN